MQRVAPAKLNLTLHITGQRPDGFHLLDSVVAFTRLGDHLQVSAADALEVVFTGEFADGLDVRKNSVIAAAEALQRHTGRALGARIVIEKNIPPGAGLGGGSADAAAALRLCNDFWQLGLDDVALESIARTLGSDMPACLRAPQPLRMQGVGEVITPCVLPAPLYVVMAHPRTPLLTAEVYRSFAADAVYTTAQPMPQNAPEWRAWLRASHNDLEPAACRRMPQLKALLCAMRELAPESVAVRMTGSGSACFAIFDHEAHAAQKETALARRFPEYWIQKSVVLTASSPHAAS